jgi:hypothetical protein
VQGGWERAAVFSQGIVPVGSLQSRRLNPEQGGTVVPIMITYLIHQEIKKKTIQSRQTMGIVSTAMKHKVLHSQT